MYEYQKSSFWNDTEWYIKCPVNSLQIPILKWNMKLLPTVLSSTCLTLFSSPFNPLFNFPLKSVNGAKMIWWVTDLAWERRTWVVEIFRCGHQTWSVSLAVCRGQRQEDRDLIIAIFHSLVSAVVIKTMTEISVGKKGFILSYSLQSIPEGKSGAEFKAGIQKQKLQQRLQEVTLLNGLLLWAFQFPFFYTPGPAA